jgi:ERF superfamily
MISHPTGPIDPLILQGPLPLPRPAQSSGEHLGKLAAKLVKVMAAIHTIPKRGRNEFFNYQYATEADVADAVRKALVAEGVILIPSIEDVREREVVTRKQQKEIVTTVTMTFTFIDGEHGGSLTFRMSGAGQDGGDKGIMKAISACVKYAALKSLCLPTGDDPEADDDESPKAAPANGRRAAPLPERESPSPSPPPWEDTPWPDDESSPATPPDRTRVSDRASAPAREPNRPPVDACISEGKLKRLHAIMQTKARDYEWEFEQLRAYVKRYVLERYSIEHLSDIPWKGRTYEDICTWVEHLGAP